VKKLLAILLLITGFVVKAQEESPWQLSGYLKYLASYSQVNKAYFPPELHSGTSFNNFDQLLHNRFDLRYYKGGWTGGIGMRTRLFQGASVEQGESFYQGLDQDAGLADLSFLYWKSDEVLMHTIFDRLWLQYEMEKWSFRLGRQRINWGMTSVFNPNDLLNQYNFLDFDYEERPGVDALRVQFFPNFSSQLELAIAPGKEEINTAALLYRNNAYLYDFQFIAGFYDAQATLGGGWAGSIGGFGFKGEANYYFENPQESKSEVLVAAADVDYVFSNGLYLTLGYLYNQSALTGLGVLAFSNVSDGQVLSPRNPYIYRNTALLSLNYPFNPLINGSLTGMYSPDGNSTIIFPSISYSLSTNWDILVAGQFFLADNDLANQEYDAFANSLFLRLKWSF